mmetsp:Transcript_30728/g.65855  ORF Transcript_30728/g.65855 Transcript_30728/m.65855 type:complete len:270 (-) Transcript_30728:805-1614(-)
MTASWRWFKLHQNRNRNRNQSHSRIQSHSLSHSHSRIQSRSRSRIQHPSPSLNLHRLLELRPPKNKSVWANHQKRSQQQRGARTKGLRPIQRQAKGSTQSTCDAWRPASSVVWARLAVACATFRMKAGKGLSIRSVLRAFAIVGALTLPGLACQPRRQTIQLQLQIRLPIQIQSLNLSHFPILSQIHSQNQLPGNQRRSSPMISRPTQPALPTCCPGDGTSTPLISAATTLDSLAGTRRLPTAPKSAALSRKAATTSSTPTRTTTMATT